MSQNKLPSQLAPRGLTITQAAAFAGLSTGAFNAARTNGVYPGPTLSGKRIDLKLLEQHMDRLSGLSHDHASPDPLAEWERKRRASND